MLTNRTKNRPNESLSNPKFKPETQYFYLENESFQNRKQKSSKNSKNSSFSSFSSLALDFMLFSENYEIAKKNVLVLHNFF
jgi:hypothetical protein